MHVKINRRTVTITTPRHGFKITFWKPPILSKTICGVKPFIYKGEHTAIEEKILAHINELYSKYNTVNRYEKIKITTYIDRLLVILTTINKVAEAVKEVEEEEYDKYVAYGRLYVLADHYIRSHFKIEPIFFDLFVNVRAHIKEADYWQYEDEYGNITELYVYKSKKGNTLYCTRQETLYSRDGVPCHILFITVLNNQEALIKTIEGFIYEYIKTYGEEAIKYAIIHVLETLITDFIKGGYRDNIVNKDTLTQIKILLNLY